MIINAYKKVRFTRKLCIISHEYNSSLSTVDLFTLLKESKHVDMSLVLIVPQLGDATL